jgi:thiol-disulfide isomerase/thioredoxin
MRIDHIQTKMSKTIHNQKVRSFLKAVKPWLLTLVLVLILRYTGAISGIAFLTQSALLKSGFMDYKPADDETLATSFDYNFTVKDLKGNLLDVKQLKGKVIFINLWATWCGPCRVEMPSIQNLYTTVDPDKIAFIMLALDTEENQHKIPKYINDKQYTFPVYVPNKSLPRQLNVSTIPTTFIVGKDGKIKSKKVGVTNYDTDKFKDFLKELAQ